MRILRIIAPWLLLLLFTCSWAGAQDAPPRVEVFAQGGGSFLNNGAGRTLVGVQCPPMICLPVPSSVASSFSKTGRASAVVSGLVSADNGWQFAWNYGGGADLALRRHLALRLELRIT